MKNIRIAGVRTLAATLAMAAATAATAADIGVSVSISEPGAYGRVDIGRFPQPQVVLAQPVLVAPQPVVIARPEPVYMWVPPGQRRDWRHYCGRYNACGVPVYFVQDSWYRQTVIEHRDDHDRPHERGGPGKGRGHGRGHDR